MKMVLHVQHNQWQTIWSCNFAKLSIFWVVQVRRPQSTVNLPRSTFALQKRILCAHSKWAVPFPGKDHDFDPKLHTVFGAGPEISQNNPFPKKNFHSPRQKCPWRTNCRHHNMYNAVCLWSSPRYWTKLAQKGLFSGSALSVFLLFSCTKLRKIYQKSPKPARFWPGWPPRRQTSSFTESECTLPWSTCMLDWRMVGRVTDRIWIRNNQSWSILS